MIFINVALTLLNCLPALPSCLDPTERCLNGGACVKQIINKVHSTMPISNEARREWAFQCSCSTGYGGEKCEKVLDVCEVFPHYCNAGTCVSVDGSAICHCSVGYFGQNCEYSFDKCKLGSICRNGGNCIDDMCICTDGFNGEFCERRVPKRDDYLRGGCEEYPEFCALRFADGTCDKECNTKKCFFDGFDCVVGAQECRLSDYCALHYSDGRCDEKCAVPQCGYDGMDCNKNMRLHDSTKSGTVGIILDATPADVLDKIYSLLAKLAQKLHNPVHLALDNNHKTRIYEWSFENGVGKMVNLEMREMSRNATGVLLYVNIDSTFCEQHINITNVFPCFADVFGAVAYLHTALYDEAKKRISLGDVTVEELFVERDSRSLPIFVIFIACFVFGITSCFCGIYGFSDLLKRNVGKNRAPVWKVPPSLQSICTNWSTVSSSEDYFPNKDSSRKDGLPQLSKFLSSSVYYKRDQAKDSTNPNQLAEISERKILVSLDAYLSDNGDENYHLGPDLLRAIKCNDMEAVSFLLLHGADVNCFDSDGNTALHHAVIVNNDQIIRLLLSTYRCNLRAVNVLGQTPLTLTVKFAHVSELCARCILDFMYNEYYREIASFSENSLSRSTFTISNDERQFSPSLEQVKPNVSVFTRDILSEKDDSTLTDIFGRTAIHYAALNRRVDLLPELYAFGLKLDIKDIKGETPLYLAAREGHSDMVNLLLALGANSAISDQLGRTPLDVAKERGHYLVVELLENAPVDKFDTLKTLKRKRNRKRSSAVKSKPNKESQVPLSSPEETIPLDSSSIATGLNEDYLEDLGDIDEDIAISSSFLNSIESFVLTPPAQILAQTENELDLNVMNPAVPDYTDLTTNSCLPPEFFPNRTFTI